MGVSLVQDKHIQGGKTEKRTEKNEKNFSPKKKRVSFSLSSLLGMLMMMMCIISPPPSYSTTIANSQPLLWRASRTPVTIGNEIVFLRIKLMNPCDLLTTEILHTDVAKIAQIRCEEMYKEHFLNEVSKMRPTDDAYIAVRAKRAIFVIGILIASVVLWAGAGTALGLAISNTVSVGDLKGITQRQNEQMLILESRINITQIAVRNLQKDFNTLVSEFEKHQRDYLEMKEKQIGTSFIISYITSRFVMIKQIIRETVREWKEKKVSNGFMGYGLFMGISLFRVETTAP
jgi:hypothetical protein